MPSPPANPFGLSPDDLAPGDRRSAGFDWAGYEAVSVDSVDHPDFVAAYDALWAEFGAAGEMESRDVLAGRLNWGDLAMRYELLLIRRAGEFAAVCDHSAVATQDGVVVHVSHQLVAPGFRGTGLAGWLRAASLRLAREMAGDRQITLAMEMEPRDDAHPGRLPRLRAAEKAGLAKVAGFTFFQPDFRPPEAIDADPAGPTPLPLSLVLRRVGREAERVIGGEELRRVVDALFGLYERSFRADVMAMARKQTVVDTGKSYVLVAPTA